MTTVARTCSVEGCTNKYAARGFCSAHYGRNKRAGVLTNTTTPTVCSVRECERPVDYSGLCGFHRKRRNEGRDLTKPRREKIAAFCEVNSCQESFHSKGFCKRHYRLNRKYQLSGPDLERMDRSGCGICGRFTVLHVDHDHNCCPGEKTCGSCNRGFLCAACNQGLGQFRDDTQLLMAAIAYLSR